MNSETTFNQRLHRMLLRARIPASVLMAVAILVLSHPSYESWLIGGLVVIVGEALRIWASGHIHKMAEVTRTGPYALCRHPLYLGHLLIAIGFCIMGDSIAALIIILLSFLAIYMPTWKNEEHNLSEKFGDTYREYMNATPALLPRWNAAAFSGSFSWAMVKTHREWNHVAGLLAGMVFMVLLGQWHSSW